VTLLNGVQSALDPHGPHAAVVTEIALVLFVGAALIFTVIMAIAALAAFGARERAARLRESWLIIGGGVIFPLVVLSLLLAYSLARARALDPAAGEDPLRIEVTGEQWWWRVRYLDGNGRPDFETSVGRESPSLPSWASALRPERLRNRRPRPTTRPKT
jgi:cytochrome c oxidase subunit 2